MILRWSSGGVHFISCQKQCFWVINTELEEIGASLALQASGYNTAMFLGYSARKGKYTYISCRMLELVKT